MGGFFAVASKDNCIRDLFYGTDYHSHLGTRRAGMAVYGNGSFERSIHNIQNTPFRTKFDDEIDELKGPLGIGCISDFEPQPLIVHSHLGSFSITTVGRINNSKELVDKCLKNGLTHFLEMSGGTINQTEITMALINSQPTLVEGIKYAQEMIDGSMSMLVMTKDGIYAARDRLGRTPIIIGKKDNAHCATFESFAFLNLGYDFCKELGPGEIVFMTPDSVETVSPAREEMKICAFLWVYFGYPTSCYEGINVEKMRCDCGRLLARRDNVSPDTVAGVPDSGIAHAIGYSNETKIPFSRPFIKYTPTWPRSFMPTSQTQRNEIAHMKLIPVKSLIENKKLLLIDDSIVRGTQLRETTEFLYNSGAKEVHIRPACPPIMFGCKYLNFSRSTSDLDLITRRVIQDREGVNANKYLEEYIDPTSTRYAEMLEDIRKQLNFTTLRYHRLDDMIEAIGLPKCKLCTYCFDGKE